MATQGLPQPSLDQGPPLPPGQQPAQPQPTMQGLAGTPSAADSGSAALQKAVITKLMFVESTLSDVAKIMPEATPVVSGLITKLRQGMGAVLAKGAVPPAAGSGPGGLLIGPGGPANSPPM